MEKHKEKAVLCQKSEVTGLAPEGEVLVMDVPGTGYPGFATGREFFVDLYRSAL
ncbi:MAG: hypothetical protein V8S73_16455 [Lachnospiraceae bacterium]